MERDCILNRLLDKYESSSHLKNPGVSRRRVMLRIEKKELPEYLYEQVEVRDAFNIAAKTLAEADIVSIEWARENVMECVALHLNEVERAYAVCSRTHPKQMALCVAQEIQETLQGITTPWILAWSEEICKEATENFKIPPICARNEGALAGLLRAFSQYEKLQSATITMRAFSSRCYQNTKTFEKEYRADFLRIAQRYHPELKALSSDNNLSVREQLAFLGIYARPELYELCGECMFATSTATVSANLFPSAGIAIPSTGVQSIQSIFLQGITKIIFIENKTNYDEYLISEKKATDLVVYHGGFLSPQKILFFQKIFDAVDEYGQVDIFFWADIDLGGFQMFSRLKKFMPALQPMRMSCDDIQRLKALGLIRNDKYWAQVKRAIEENEFIMFKEELACLLNCQVTIEQEAFLFD